MHMLLKLCRFLSWFLSRFNCMRRMAHSPFLMTSSLEYSHILKEYSLGLLQIRTHVSDSCCSKSLTTSMSTHGGLNVAVSNTSEKYVALTCCWWQHYCCSQVTTACQLRSGYADMLLRHMSQSLVNMCTMIENNLFWANVDWNVQWERSEF